MESRIMTEEEYLNYIQEEYKKALKIGISIYFKSYYDYIRTKNHKN